MAEIQALIQRGTSASHPASALVQARHFATNWRRVWGNPPVIKDIALLRAEAPTSSRPTADTSSPRRPANLAVRLACDTSPMRSSVNSVSLWIWADTSSTFGLITKFTGESRRSLMCTPCAAAKIPDDFAPSHALTLPTATTVVVEAESESVLDDIERALRDAGLLVKG